MRTATTQILGLLNDDTRYVMADCVTVTFPDTTVARWTTADHDITLRGADDPANWVVGNAVTVTTQAASVLGPLSGRVVGIRETAVTSTHFSNRVISPVADTLYTASVAIKPDGRTIAALVVFCRDGTERGVLVNLATAAVIAPTNSPVMVKVAALKSDWVACTTTVNVNHGASSPRVRVYPGTAGPTFNYAGDITKGLLIQAMDAAADRIFFAVPTAPLVKRGPTRTSAGLEVDTLELTLSVGGDGNPWVGGVPLPQFALAGGFDGARILLERAVFDTWADRWAGAVVIFEGEVSDVRPSSTAVTLTVKSDLAKLTVAMPRNLYQTGCGHVLYDGGCGLSKATYTDAGVVGSVSSVTSFRSDLTEANDFYTLGTGIFTSGLNDGVRFAVRSYVNTNGVVGVVTALPVAPAPGDTFDIAPGCDKARTTCDTKFANLAHFRGFPFIPVPETIR